MGANWLSAMIFLSGLIILYIGVFNGNWYFIIGGFLIQLIIILDNIQDFFEPKSKTKTNRRLPRSITIQ